LRARDQAGFADFGAVKRTDSRHDSQIVRKNSGKKIRRLTNGDVILSMSTPTQEAPTIPMVTVTRKVMSRFMSALS
jgi:hypothetical protein